MNYNIEWKLPTGHKIPGTTVKFNQTYKPFEFVRIENLYGSLNLALLLKIKNTASKSVSVVFPIILNKEINGGNQQIKRGKEVQEIRKLLLISSIFL